MKKRMLLAVGCMTAFFAFSQNDVHNRGVVVGKDTMIYGDLSYGYLTIKDKNLDSLVSLYSRSLRALDEVNLELKQVRARKILNSVKFTANEPLLKAFRETFSQQELEGMAADRILAAYLVITNEGRIIGVSFALKGEQQRVPKEKWVLLSRKLKENVVFDVPMKEMKYLYRGYPFYLDQIAENGLASHPSVYVTP